MDKKNYFKYSYVNPILKLRVEQLESLKAPYQMESNLRSIFNTIPKNLRKIFMYDVDYDKAVEMVGVGFENKLKNCLEYCTYVIG